MFSSPAMAKVSEIRPSGGIARVTRAGYELKRT
jgi:hypothetical protein